jgi:hypothetical protein
VTQPALRFRARHRAARPAADRRVGVGRQRLQHRVATLGEVLLEQQVHHLGAVGGVGLVVHNSSTGVAPGVADLVEQLATSLVLGELVGKPDATPYAVELCASGLSVEDERARGNADDERLGFDREMHRSLRELRPTVSWFDPDEAARTLPEREPNTQEDFKRSTAAKLDAA